MSAYAIRSALRQMLILEGLPSNRSRVNDGGAPKVEFKDFPDPNRYADDFLFGFCVTDRAAVADHPDRSLSDGTQKYHCSTAGCLTHLSETLIFREIGIDPAR